jgi:hypothetical protein
LGSPRKWCVSAPDFEPSLKRPITIIAERQLYQSPDGEALHSGLLCRGRLRPESERKVFSVPRPRRPEDRATPLDIARLLGWLRDSGSRG